MGKMFFNILAALAGFELDLLRARTREGMAIAEPTASSGGRQPKLNRKQRTEPGHCSGDQTTADLAEIFGVSRATVYRTLSRHEEESEGPHDQ